MLARRALAAAVATALWVGIAFPTRAAAPDNEVANASNSASIVLGKRFMPPIARGAMAATCRASPYGS
jgi:hypothetical protein